MTKVALALGLGKPIFVSTIFRMDIQLHTVNFVENNQMITASRIQKFSTRTTVNVLSTSNILI